MIVSMTDHPNFQRRRRVALRGKEIDPNDMQLDDERGDVDHPECLMVCSDFVLGTLSMAVTDLVEQTLEPLDLRLRHYRLLRLLYFEGSRPQSTIGPVLGVDRTTVVAIVDHLEKLKLAKRVRSEEDRRVYLVTITDRGRSVTEKANELTNAVETSMFSPLSDE